jgi:hypothetical protein
MTFTFEFTLPYNVVEPESRLEAAQQEAASNASAESDLSGFSGSVREYRGNRIQWTLNGLNPSDLSPETRQAVITAIQNHLPGAAEFEIVE